MKITPAKLLDVIYVLDHLSEQTAAEMAVLDIGRWNLLKMVRPWLDGAVTAWWKGHPGFVFGIRPDSKASWFLATREYFAGGLPAIRAGRKFVERMVTLSGGFVVLSLSPHPDSARWFRLLGLREGSQMGAMRLWYAGVTNPVNLATLRIAGR